MQLRAGTIAYHPNPIPARGVADNCSRACVYVPQASTNRVLYLLHGVGDNEYSWEIQGCASQIVEALVPSGAQSPPLIVMPFGFVTQHNKLLRRFPDVDEFGGHLRQLIQDVESRYESDAKLAAGVRERALAGLSMGGKQALEYGFSHPEGFSAIGSFSAAVQDRGQGSSVDRVVELAATARAKGFSPRLYGSCGAEDDVKGLLAANQELEQMLAARGIAQHVRRMAGKHEWSVWRASLEEFLRFWLGAPQAPQAQ